MPRLLTAMREAGFEDVAGAAPQPRRLHRPLGPARVTEARPAFYALAPGGWRDYVTLLHPPYTAWHLSYVAIGACLAPHALRRAGSRPRSSPSSSRSGSPRTRWTS